jgi:IgA Peptidase M64
MSSTDGMVIGTTQIVNNGPPQNRYNIVLVAEGYQQAELGKFATDAQQYVLTHFSAPSMSIE